MNSMTSKWRDKTWNDLSLALSLKFNKHFLFMLTQRLTDFATSQESLLTSELVLVQWQSPGLLRLRLVVLLSYYGGLVSQAVRQAVLTSSLHTGTDCPAVSTGWRLSTPPGFVISYYWSLKCPPQPVWCLSLFYYLLNWSCLDKTDWSRQ